MKIGVAQYQYIFHFLIMILLFLSGSLGAAPISDLIKKESAEKEVLPAVEVSVDELRLFVEVMQRIKSAYVDPVSDKELMRNAIRGMIQGLDKYSAFLTVKELRQIRESAAGMFAGIGIEVSVQKDFIRIIKPIHGSPASKAGLLAGDKITHLNGNPIQSLLPNEITNHMRGNPGSILSLVVKRQKMDKPIHFKVAREIITISSVKHRWISDGYAYIKISHFQSNTAKELLNSYSHMHKNKGLKGLIIDLRDNPGGVLQAAVEVADLFLPKGTIVSTQGRMHGSDLQFQATRSAMAKGIPLAILINGNSASASEIVAGALQDHKRAIIVGDKSYGKGSIQSIVPLFSGPEQVGLKLTTARYVTPNGHSIHTRGITPDITVKAQSLDKPDQDMQLTKALMLVKSSRETDYGFKADKVAKLPI